MRSAFADQVAELVKTLPDTAMPSGAKHPNLSRPSIQTVSRFRKFMRRTGRRGLATTIPNRPRILKHALSSWQKPASLRWAGPIFQKGCTLKR